MTLQGADQTEPQKQGQFNAALTSVHRAFSYEHKCMATADRAVFVFVKEIQWDKRIDHSKTI